MPKITYVSIGGAEHVIDAASGDSVMATAVRNGVPGIIGECGGNISCGTCHVWVRPEYAGLVGTPDELEEDLIDMGVSEPRPTSRLSCQIEITPALDGLVVDIPGIQP